MRLFVEVATEADAEAIAVVRTAAAEQLTDQYGRGHWSSVTSSRSVSRDIQICTVLIARSGRRVVGTLTLVRKKPWAIDPAYFSPVPKPLYLVSMAVDPATQRRGVGRCLIEAAKGWAGRLRFEAIRLDAYNALAGAGGFYLKCGFREVGRVTYRTTPLIYFEFLLQQFSEPKA